MNNKESSNSTKPVTRPAAIVSGAGTGIGAAVAVRLAADGYAVLAVYRGSEDGARRTVQTIEKAGGTASMQRADVAVRADVEAAFARCLELFGNVAVVINNAGIGHMAPLAEITDEDYNRIFDTNTRGVFHMCREAARHIGDAGSIVNISTGMTVSSMAGMALYTASKMAVEGFTKTLAHELGPRGININSVSPGLTDTPMIAGMDRGTIDKLGQEQSVMRRIGQPEDVAAAVSILVSPDGHWITGQNIHADGGSIIV